MIRHISLFLCKSAEPKPCVFSSFLLFSSSVLPQQQQQGATHLHYLWLIVERINSFEIVFYNGHESIMFLRQKSLRQKINSSQIKVSRIHWAPTIIRKTLETNSCFHVK